MGYSCSDFTDTILDALGIVVPDEAMDDPSAQADLALEKIEALKSAVAVLKAIMACPQVAPWLVGLSVDDVSVWDMARSVIADAEG